MASIGFLGLGNMGGGAMAENLVKAGHRVRGFDLSAEALAAFAGNGGIAAASAAEAVADAEIIVSMLPARPACPQSLYRGGRRARRCGRGRAADRLLDHRCRQRPAPRPRPRPSAASP